VEVEAGGRAVALEEVRGPPEGQPWALPDLGMTLLPVAAGSFQMGSSDGESDEKPVRTVRLTRPFWMGKHEVTQREYEKLTGRNPSSFKGDDPPSLRFGAASAVPRRGR
jgi:formylglycine-generating enzyme required for sulfatase activity